MKIGIDNYCYHRFFGEVYPDQQKPEKNMSLSAFLNRAQVLGVQAVTLEASFLPSLTDTYMLELKSLLDGYGLERIFSWGHPDGLERGLNEESFSQMKSLIPFAKKIGASLMRIVASNFVWRGEDKKEQIDRLIPQLTEAAKIAQDNNIRLAVENNIDFTGQEMLRLIEGVNSPYVGVDLDTGNFLRLLDDPLRAADILAEHTLAVHLKDVQVNPKEARPTDWYFFSCVPIGQGLVDNEAIVTTLKKAGYKGYVGVGIDHPHTDWYGREDEMVELSVRELKELVDNAG